MARKLRVKLLQIWYGAPHIHEHTEKLLLTWELRQSSTSFPSSETCSGPWMALVLVIRIYGLMPTRTLLPPRTIQRHKL